MSTENISIENFNGKNLKAISFNSDMMKNQENRKSYSTYLMYKNNNLKLKTEEIKLTEGGILPYINRKTGKPFIEDIKEDDPKRYYIMIPLDETMKKVITKIDEYMESNKTTILECFKSKNYEYKQILKPIKEATMYSKMDKMKVNFESDFNTKEIKTKVYKERNDKIKEVNIKEFKELEEMIKLNTIIRLILKVSKIWINKDNKYGINVVCEQILIKDTKESICGF